MVLLSVYTVQMDLYWQDLLPELPLCRENHNSLWLAGKDLFPSELALPAGC